MCYVTKSCKLHVDLRVIEIWQKFFFDLIMVPVFFKWNLSFEVFRFIQKESVYKVYYSSFKSMVKNGFYRPYN